MKARTWDIDRATWLSAWAEWPAGAFVVAHGLDRSVCARRGDVADPSDLDVGDAFGEAGGVRWRSLGDGVRAVVVGDWPAPDAFGAAAGELDLGGAERRPGRHVLWGRRAPGETFWAEARVPHLFEEPLGHPTGLQDDPPAGGTLRRAVLTEHFLDARTGAPLFERFVSVASLPDDALPPTS